MRVRVDMLDISEFGDDTGAFSGTCSGLDTLDAIHKQKGRTILGVSNISFGLPQRDFVTAGFFTMAMERGLSAAIMNPNSTEMMKAYFCFCTLRGYDPNCSRYIEFVEEYTKQQALQESQQLQSQMPKALNTTSLATFSGTPQQDKNSLQYAIIRGLKKEAQDYTQKLLQTDAPLDIINNHLIPALDHVGKGFEAKTLFLPQLLMSAEAAKEAFKEIKTHLAGSGTAEESKGTIVLATVKGDIHDIGKNIVKVLLENYSFTVIDLGKDVPPEKIAETVEEKLAENTGDEIGIVRAQVKPVRIMIESAIKDLIKEQGEVTKENLAEKLAEKTGEAHSHYVRQNKENIVSKMLELIENPEAKTSDVILNCELNVKESA